MNKYKEIDTVRSILIIFLILYHVGLVFCEQKNWGIKISNGNISFDFMTSWLVGFFLHCFYLISGFLCFHTHKRYGLRENIQIRFTRFVIPSISCMLSFQFIQLAVVTSERTGLPVSEILAEVNWVNYFFEGGWVGHLWFINNLFCYYILFIFASTIHLEKTNKKINQLIIVIQNNNNTAYLLWPVIISVSIAIAIITKKAYPGMFIISFALPFDFFYYLPYFIFGIYTAKYKELYEWIKSCKTLKAINYFLIYSVIILYFLILEKYNIISNRVLYVTSKTLYSLYGILLCRSIFSISNNYIHIFMKIKIFNNFLESINKASYTIYLTQQPIIMGIAYLIKTTQPEMNIFKNFVLLSTVTLITCYSIHLLINRFTLLKLLYNGRPNRKNPNIRQATP